MDKGKQRRLFLGPRAQAHGRSHGRVQLKPYLLPEEVNRLALYRVAQTMTELADWTPDTFPSQLAWPVSTRETSIATFHAPFPRAESPYDGRTTRPK